MPLFSRLSSNSLCSALQCQHVDIETTVGFGDVCCVNPIKKRLSLIRARNTKENRYPELSGQRGRARLVVLGIEVGGRWSEESWKLIRTLSKYRSRTEPELLRKSSASAWHRRWTTLLAVATQRAVATSLLFLPDSGGSNGDVPSTVAVLEDARYA